MHDCPPHLWVVPTMVSTTSLSISAGLCESHDNTVGFEDEEAGVGLTAEADVPGVHFNWTIVTTECDMIAMLSGGLR